jgi:hypothetical protein
LENSGPLATSENSLCKKRLTKYKILDGGGTVTNRKLDLVFVDKNGKFYPLDEVNRSELAEGLEKISKEIAKRLSLQKEQR